jgi:hypothetical protein
MSSAKETRFFYFEDSTRAAATSTGKLKGYAVVFNTRADIGPFFEIIHPDAANRTMRDNVDTLALFNHDWGKVIGRRSAETLRMSVDERGLAVEVTLPNTSVGKDVAESVGRGDIRGMSFKIDKPVYQITGQDNRGKRTLTLMDMVIPEVSVVSNPAYIDTEVSLRCLQDLQKTEEGRAVEFLKRQMRQREREKAR